MRSYVRAEKPLINEKTGCEHAALSHLPSLPGPRHTAAGYAQYGAGGTGENARANLLSGVGDIEGGSGRLHDSTSKVLETEQIGNEVLSNLQRQRETIAGTSTTFDDMESSHAQMDGVLRNMGFNALTNKYLCYFVVFLIICTLVMVFLLSMGT